MSRTMSKIFIFYFTLTLSFGLTTFCSTTYDLRAPWSIAGIPSPSYMLVMDTAVRLEKMRLNIVTDPHYKLEAAQQVAINKLMVEQHLEKKRVDGTHGLRNDLSSEQKQAVAARMEWIHRFQIERLLESQMIDMIIFEAEVTADPHKLIVQRRPDSTHLRLAQSMIDACNRLYA